MREPVPADARVWLELGPAPVIRMVGGAGVERRRGSAVGGMKISTPLPTESIGGGLVITQPSGDALRAGAALCRDHYRLPGGKSRRPVGDQGWVTSNDPGNESSAGGKFFVGTDINEERRCGQRDQTRKSQGSNRVISDMRRPSLKKLDAILGHVA